MSHVSAACAAGPWCEWLDITHTHPLAPRLLATLSLLENGSGHRGDWLFVGGSADIGLLSGILARLAFEDGLYWTI